MDTEQIPAPALPPDWNTLEKLTPQNVQAFVWDYLGGKPIDQLAASFGLTFRQARDILNHPEVLAEIDAALELARTRQGRLIEVALTEAIDVLLETVRDVEAPHETRRKAAGQIIRLHKDLRKQAETASRPAESPPHAPPLPAPHAPPPRTRKERRAAQRLEHQRAPIPQPIAA